ncbi:hypothetical protein Tco_1455696 [Tanacetum coccineum]
MAELIFEANNAYHGRIDEDVLDHIAKVLEILDLIKITNVDTHRLRKKVFPLSLADDARQWWMKEGEGKITTWEELVDRFFCKFYPESYDGEDEMLDGGDNWGIDPLEFISRVNSSFEKHMKVNGRTKKPYSKNHEKNNVENEDEQNQTKRKYSNLENDILNNASNSDNEHTNKRVCKAEKFEAIKYSLGPNEEYIAIRRCEYNAWERNEDSMSKIYQEIFLKKENGWKVTRTE